MAAAAETDDDAKADDAEATLDTEEDAEVAKVEADADATKEVADFNSQKSFIANLGTLLQSIVAAAQANANAAGVNVTPPGRTYFVPPIIPVNYLDPLAAARFE